jgi:arginyl-tRNA synthetase
MDPALFAVGRPPKPEMGDLAVGCFPAARERKMAPPALAAQVADGFSPTEELLEAKAAGPFVNFKVNREAMYSHLRRSALAETPSLVPTSDGAGKTVCIDYSSPNISKQLAYHHIRSTCIGHALVNLYRALGYKVVGINHLGDWGTTHGMLLAAYNKWGAEEPITIAALNDLYVRWRAAMKEDESLAEEGRQWFAKLEAGDPECRATWQRFKDISWAEFDSVYKTLGITFEEVKGESDFIDDVPAVLEMLDEKGLSSVSQGALVVDLEEDGMPPLLLKKQDGATLYATRDIAAAIYRHDTYDFERSLYVVDRGQSLHFKQLFRTLEKAGFEWSARCIHVPFGLVRIGGKKTTTRGGDVVLLKEVFGEATSRARVPISEKNPDMDAGVLEKTASQVGVGAVVFANLMSQRDKDVDFDWEEILSTSGDSGVYVQYAHARCCSILARAEWNGGDADLSLLDGELEWALAMRLSELGDSVRASVRTNEPHLIARYLLEVGALVARWYQAGQQDKSLRVLCDDPAVRAARLSLVATTREYLKQGLALLGLGAPEAM